MDTSENKQSNFDKTCKALNVLFMAGIFSVLVVWFGFYLSNKDTARPRPPAPKAELTCPKAGLACPKAGGDCDKISGTCPRASATDTPTQPTTTSRSAPGAVIPVPVKIVPPPAPAAKSAAKSAAKPAAPAARVAVRPVRRFPRVVVLPPPRMGWPFFGDDDPFARIAAMQEHMANWLGDDAWDLAPSSPGIDMREGKDGFDISFELPDWADPKTLKVDTHDDVLSLSVKSEDQRSIMKQDFRVPGSGIGTNAIDAAVSNGVLRVHVHPVKKD